MSLEGRHRGKREIKGEDEEQKNPKPKRMKASKKAKTEIIDLTIDD